METLGGILACGSFVWLIVAIAIIAKKKRLRICFGILLVPVWLGLVFLGGVLLPPTEKVQSEQKGQDHFPFTLQKRKQIYLEYTKDDLWKYDDGTDYVPIHLNKRYMKTYHLTASQLYQILQEGGKMGW